MRISLEMIGVQTTRQQVDKLKARPASRGLWSTVAQIMKSETLRCFAEERAPSGAKWKPLSDAALRSRAYSHTKGARKRLKRIPGNQSAAFKKAMGGARILQDTGRLRASISVNHGAGWAEVGTTIKYAPTHQYGDKRRNIPARPFIGLSQSMRDRIQATTRKWLEEGV